MTEADSKWKIDATLRSVGFERVDSSLSQYRGHLKPSGYEVEVELTVPDGRFVELPTLKVLNKEVLPVDVVAHIERDERLCFGDKQLLRLDRYNPGGSILRILEQAKETLNKSLGGQNAIEIQEEFPAYWNGGDAQLLTMLHNLEGMKSAKVGRIENKKGLQLVPSMSKSAKTLINERNAKIVKVDGVIGASSYCLRPSTLADLQSWLPPNTGSKLTVDAIISASMEEKVYIIHAANGWFGFNLIIPDALLGLKRQNKLRKVTLVKLLKDKPEKVNVQRYLVTDATLASVASRSLPNTRSPLIGKNILVIGAGTIGSHLSELLTRSGAGCEGTLTLVDPDYVGAGNLGRHTLSVESLWENKALALKSKLLNFHPDLKVEALEKDADSLLDYLDAYDLVIDATGIEAVSDDINFHALRLRRDGKDVALLHAWIFGNGISVHSFFHNSLECACYRCLRPDLSKPWRYDSRKDTSKEAVVAQNGCGLGTFVPYTISASVKAAALAFDAVFEFFDVGSGPTLRNQLIDSSLGKNIAHNTPSIHTSCPACKA